MPDALQFRELRGDYVEAKGQVIEPHEYLDYFEPLGSALSRLPDGVGGPFVHQFRRSGGRVTGAIGWVVSAAAKRLGGWKLWGMWTDRAIPPLTLPLVWPQLSDALQLPEVIRLANENADRLNDRDFWDAVELDERLSRDQAFRSLVKAQLARAYASPITRERPIEVEVDRTTLDTLPWLYLLGPVNPTAAQLQPSRFNGAGYQYIVTESAHVPAATQIPRDIDRMVDLVARDPVEGSNLAAELREQRTRPKTAPPPKRQPEIPDMPTPPPRKQLNVLTPTIWRVLCDVVVIALLAWIAIDVRHIRKSIVAAPVPQPAAITQTTEPEETIPPPTREERIVQALTTNPPDGIRIDRAALASSAKLPHVAVEIFLRRNRCFTGTAAVDGAFSAAEQRAIRTCAALREARLVKTNGEPDARALDWLERAVAP